MAADDHERSRCLLSPLKGADRRLIRQCSDVPAPYSSLELVNHRAEINAPYSRDALAVKFLETDAVAWASYALARIEVRQDELEGIAVSESSAVGSTTVESKVSTPIADRTGVMRPLLELGRAGLDVEWVGSSSFTPNGAADQLLIDDPFAFSSGRRSAGWGVPVGCG